MVSGWMGGWFMVNLDAHITFVIIYLLLQSKCKYGDIVYNTLFYIDIKEIFSKLWLS